MSSPSGSQQELAIFADRVLAGVSTTRKIGDALSSKTDEVTTVRRRWGIVTGVNIGDGTVDVRVDGIILPNTRRVAWYQPYITETVIVEYAGNDPVCIGPVGASSLNQFAQINHVHAPSASSTVPTTGQTIGGNYADGFVSVVKPYVGNTNTDLIQASMGGNSNMHGPDAGPIDSIPDGRKIDWRWRAFSADRTVAVQTATVGNNAGFILPSGITSPITVFKDSWTTMRTRWNATEKAWFLESFVSGHKRAETQRPFVMQRWTKGGTGTSVSMSTGQGIGPNYIAVLFHCNDYGYYGEMLPPSGTIPASDWTFLGGGGKDFAAHVNCWAAVVPSGATSTFIATVNQQFTFSTEIFLYFLGNVQFPKASQFKIASSTAPVNRQLAVSNFTPNSTYENLQLITWSYADKAQITNMFAGLQGADTGATPLLIDGSDANGTYSTGLSTNRFLDTYGNQGDMYTDTTAATDFAAGTLILSSINGTT